MASTADLGTLKVNDFSQHLNASFELQDPKGKPVTTLKLVEAVANVVSRPAATPSGDRIIPMPRKLAAAAAKAKIVGRDGGGFTLQFVAPVAARLKQGIYPIKHPKLGTLKMFLTPTGFVHGGRGYHAVFG
jgi:hypothetical protein